MSIPTIHQELDKSSKTADALYAQIVSRVRQWVREGNLKEGDFLPSERELAEMFGVSRVPVREALKTLEFLGIVQHVRGRGVTVRRVTLNHVLNHVELIIVDPITTLHELFEVREALEVQAAGLAAARRTDEEITEMENALVDTELYIRRNREIVDTSMRFHSALIKAAHNGVSLTLNQLLLELLRFSRNATLKKHKLQMEALRSHRRILEAVRARDVKGAKTAMLHHLNLLNSTLPD